jgi:tetratricopeptide (TPR) repeat protein
MDEAPGPQHEVEMVNLYLRGQNLEQLGRFDEAAESYEAAVAGSFDSTGPYDRLIALYSSQARHPDVIRVADLALENVRTYEDKRDWYVRMKSEATKASQKVLKGAPRKG